jgi:hypothetical protein
MLEGTHKLVGEEVYARYRSLLDRRVTTFLLGSTDDSSVDLGF